jgi:predicted ATP-grasp superfamily ATP-dependent carboligase
MKTIDKTSTTLLESLPDRDHLVQMKSDLTNSELEKCLVGNKVGYLRGEQVEFSLRSILVDISNAADVVRQCALHASRSLLPIYLSEQQVVIENATWLRSRGIQFLTSNWDVVFACHNKQKFIELMQHRGFIRYLPATPLQPEFPYVLKKVEDSWGKNTHLIRCLQDTNDLSSMLRQGEYIIQEYIPGRCEYASHILFNRGKIRHITTVKNYHASDFYIQGLKDAPIKSEFVPTDRNVVEIFEKILTAIDYCGICCFDYKLKDCGTPLIFEINPRPGASLTYSRPVFDEMIERYLAEVALPR